MKLRFAPSLAGMLHVGSARIALANYLTARRHGGDLLLRLDDIDTERSKPELAHALRDALQHDLRWLGVEWGECVKQSDRLDRYAEAADRLRAAGRLYPCFESEEELQAKRDQRVRRGRAPVYDRAMLKLTAEQRAAAEAGGKRPYWRFLLSGYTPEWTDTVLGRCSVKLPSISDPVLVRADGTPTYTLTSIVDDLELGLTHVVHGEDHVTNTGVQLDILAALGGNPAAIRFAHLPLLVGDDGGKLSKRSGGLTLRSLRQDGVEASALAAYLARLGGSGDPAPTPMAELAAGFDLGRIGRAPPRFDARQLLGLNRRALHALPFEAVRDRLPPAATAAFWAAVRGNLDLLSEVRGWWDVVAGTIVPPVIEGEGPFLHGALEALPPEPWGDGVWDDWVGTLRTATGRKGRGLLHPLRLALTGEDQGPDLRGLLPLMGRDRAAERLRLAAS